MSSFDDLDGLTCRVGTPEQGVLRTIYAADGAVTLKCVATTLFELTVAKEGTGLGTVSSSPAGISCGVDCSESYPAGSVVTLTAAPGVGASFSGWSGACTGTVATCQVTTTAAKSVTATFTAMTRLSVGVSNSIDNGLFTNFDTNSVVASATGFSCTQSGRGSTSCPVDVPIGVPITFTAVPDGSDSFDHWSTTIPECNASTSLSCTFTPQASTIGLTGVFASS